MENTELPQFSIHLYFEYDQKSLPNVSRKLLSPCTKLADFLKHPDCGLIVLSHVCFDVFQVILDFLYYYEVWPPSQSEQSSNLRRIHFPTMYHFSEDSDLNSLHFVWAAAYRLGFKMLEQQLRKIVLRIYYDEFKRQGKKLQEYTVRFILEEHVMSVKITTEKPDAYYYLA